MRKVRKLLILVQICLPACVCFAQIGNNEWVKTYGHTNYGSLFASNAARLPSGDFIVASKYSSESIFLAKVSRSGEVIWHSIESNLDAYNFIVDSEENVFINASNGVSKISYGKPIMTLLSFMVMPMILVSYT